LSRGTHHVRLEYVQLGGDLALDWSWERKGSGFSAVPAWALSQHAVNYPTAIAAYFVDQARPVAAALSVLGAIWCVVVGLRLSAAVAVVGYGLPALFILHASIFWGRGIMDEEATGFVINYLAKRPLAAIIFDPRLNDYGLYQARELSYFFDYADARVFAALLDRHILSFIPLSGAFGLIMAAAIYLYGTRRVLRLDAVTAGLLLALFLSCIVTQASTAIFYRSAKMMLTVALLAFLFQLTELVRERDDGRRVSGWKLAGLFLLGLNRTQSRSVFESGGGTGNRRRHAGADWLDRQGVGRWQSADD
jgi:hypothetical protein